MCASRHRALADMLDARFSRYLLGDTDCDLTVSIIANADDSEKTTESEFSRPDESEISFLENVISENLKAVYPHLADTSLPTKLSVSEISKPDAVQSLRTPNFSEEKELSAAQKGTAIHTFMQFADYSLAVKSIDTEIKRLVEKGFITRRQADAIDPKKIDKFFASDIAKSIFDAEEIHREFRFMMPARVCDLFPTIDSDEEIMVQGVADCIIETRDEYIILDYKSDAVRDMSVLKERYEAQLSLYKRAISELFESEKVRCIIYSFTLGDYIEI